ncbi:MAG: hypothetical protein ACKVON_08110 [Beijerinckiaceae bacterium]
MTLLRSFRTMVSAAFILALMTLSSFAQECVSVDSVLSRAAAMQARVIRLDADASMRAAMLHAAAPPASAPPEAVGALLVQLPSGGAIVTFVHPSGMICQSLTIRSEQLAAALRLILGETT